MKILVKYEFDVASGWPFKASTTLDGKWVGGSSKQSYLEAEADLVATIRKQLRSSPVPEPREVEIEL